MNYVGKFAADVSHSNVHFNFDSHSRSGSSDTVTLPNAHLLFSGDYERSGADLIVSDRDHRRNRPAGLAWLSNGVIIAGPLGTPDTTAIVHPHKFTSAVMSAAQRNGAQLRQGRATGIRRSDNGSVVTGVEIDDRAIEADAVVCPRPGAGATRPKLPTERTVDHPAATT